MNHQDAQTPQIGRYEDSIVISKCSFSSQCHWFSNQCSLRIMWKLLSASHHFWRSMLYDIVSWLIQANRCSERDFSLFFTTHSRCIWKKKNIIEYVFIYKRVEWLFSRCLDVCLLMISHLKPILKSFHEYIYSSLY